MIHNGIVIGLRPEEIRDMIPKDTWLCFDGWKKAHEPKKPGSEAMTAAEYRELVRQVDGGYSRAA
ncbi:MAG: hypothetical protein ACO3GP_02140 [Candidatus Limnocylindrus sp.]